MRKKVVEQNLERAFLSDEDQQADQHEHRAPLPDLALFVRHDEMCDDAQDDRPGNDVESAMIGQRPENLPRMPPLQRAVQSIEHRVVDLVPYSMQGREMPARYQKKGNQVAEKE